METDKKKDFAKILVACHKQDPAIRLSEPYMPVHVGKKLHPDLDLGFQGDDTGDNISDKNGSYCELTALYWAWKNLGDTEYIGLCHYRRYLDFDLSEENIKKTFQKYDIVIPEIKHQFAANFYELVSLTSYEDTYIFLDTLLGMLPDQRSLIFETFMRSNKFTVCNMFVMRREDFNEYCEFLFTLLSEMEKKVKPGSYSRLRRVYGYMSEPLLGFWIKYKNWKVREVPMDQGNAGGHRYSLLEKKLHNLRCAISLKMQNFHYRRYWGDFSCGWMAAGLKQDNLNLPNLPPPD